MDQPRILIGMATYQRPSELARMLPALGAQIRGRPSAAIVVVDNDPAGGARPIVAVSAPSARYVHELRPGIAHARNRILLEAEGYDLLAFIDDDEVPGPHWLDSLLATRSQWHSAAVTGPTVARFDGAVAAGIRESPVFRRRRLTTGTTVSAFATNNVLLDLDVVRSAGLRFDERFGLSGGSDTLFSRQLVAAGHVIRWCDEAEVEDFIPAERATAQWVRARTRRTGATWSRVALALAHSRRGRLRLRIELTARGSKRIVSSSASWMIAATHRDAAGKFAAVLGLISGVFMTAGAWGLQRHEYRRRT